MIQPNQETKSCKATIRSGHKCKKTAGVTGLCPAHDKLHKEKDQRSLYKIAMGAVLAACKLKGWASNVESADGRCLATIEVWKEIDGVTITGLLHFTVQKDIKYSIEKTSFYGYGIEDLLRTVSFKLKESGRFTDKNEAAKKSPQEIEAAARKQREAQLEDLIIRLLRNFDRAARQLRRRHDDRSSYIISDEYDVQDLLHAILRAYFDDVRPEEQTGSFAGASSRMDFLLKDENAVIEVKFASERLRAKQVGEQLIIDIKKYQAHPDCRALYCLVYDPESCIQNPKGLERDLSRMHDALNVNVIVVPS